MDWDRYDLYFGPTRVGTVIYDDSFDVEQYGNFIDDPALAKAETAEAVRLANFVALSRERSRLLDVEEDVETSQKLEALNAELETFRAEFIGPDRWWLVDGQGHHSPILCPEFRGDDEIVWCWNRSED